MPRPRDTAALLEELFGFLRIPSISSGDGDPADLQRAADWVAARVREAGGEAEVRATRRNPLAVGRFRSGRPGGPHLLVYGHYDVQTVAPLEAWDSPPFEPEIRDGWLYARGASDDKGNFHCLFAPLLELAAAGELRCDVTVVADGEEEVGGDSVVRWLEAEDARYDAALIFDSDMVGRGRPALTTAVRGVMTGRLRVQTGTRDVHSGMYGGVALNAAHVLSRLVASTEARDGRLIPALEEGIVEPSPTEVASWADLPTGAEELATAGIAAVDAAALREYHQRTTARPTFDVNAITCRDARQERTIVPSEAEAAISMRLAPGQDSAAIWAALEQHLVSLTPPGAELTLTLRNRADGRAFDPDAPALVLAREAIETATGTRCVLKRSGGAIPLMTALGARGIPAVLSGVALPEDNIHAPNERLLVSNYEIGMRMGRELLNRLAELPKGH
jgi:acetylornithine deacetylase/succinyl-diaminopimelate desuccinylase-like protein